MGYFFDQFWFEPGSRMTGIWDAASNDEADDLRAFAHLVTLGPTQDGVVESSFLGAHLPYHLGGFHGVGPDGHPWTVVLQVAPEAIAGFVGAGSPYWTMVDAMDRALQFNSEAECTQRIGWTREDLLDIYQTEGVHAAGVAGWSLPDLMRGLLAECCYVPLEQIVAGRLTQCAFPERPHDCQHDVFADVFALWTTGAFNPPEPRA